MTRICPSGAIALCLLVSAACAPAPAPTALPAATSTLPPAAPTATPIPPTAAPTQTATPTAPPTAVPKARLKIMPLGDSITYGWPDTTYGGYRHLLWTLLTNDGYRFDFVGSQQSGEGAVPEPDNEGHPGWTIPKLKDGIDTNGWLETYQPDLILLHIGRNDIDKQLGAAAPANLTALLDDILARLPNSRVVVAQIIPPRAGAGQLDKAYAASIPGIVASKGARVTLVDMQHILTPADYADVLHPNAGGYDKMARAWEPAIRAVEPLTSIAPSTSAQTLTWIPGSTTKLEQPLGEEDKQLHQPTLSRTQTRYGIEGTDLGYSFEHEGRLYFLFGDTVGKLDRALDTIATADAGNPEQGVRLDFLTVGGNYLTIQPPGISMGAFETPIGGISLGGQMYVAVRTNHAPDWSTDRSVLTRFTLPATFQPLRTLSRAPAGHFLTLSLHLQPGPLAALPAGGPFVFVWGTGHYRQSDAYLSLVPAASFESGQGTRYFAGLDAAGAPAWSASEADARPILRNGTLGDLSVTWSDALGLWLLTADSRPPAPRGILFSYARTPWGPWSEPQLIFDEVRDGALGKFIHDPHVQPDDGLAGPCACAGQANPSNVQGGAYAPYVVERWTKVQGAELDLYYGLSTWNPYVVVLMKSRLKIG